MSHSLNHSDFSRLWLKKHITYEVIWRYPITLTLSFFFRQVEKLPASVVSSFSGSCLRETDKVLQRLGPLHPTHPVQPWTVSSCHKPPALTQKKHLGIFTSPTWNVREVAMDIHFMSLTYPLCAVWFVEDGLQPHQQNHTKKGLFRKVCEAPCRRDAPTDMRLDMRRWDLAVVPQPNRATPLGLRALNRHGQICWPK